MSDRWVAVLSGLLFIDFLLSVVMLVTDKNLQTDFGAQGAYYAHWYGVLGMAVLDVMLAVSLAWVASTPDSKRLASSGRRGLVIAGFAWATLSVVALLGIVTSYSQVGFSTMSQFETYLFGTTPYPGALSYIPWLYDALLSAYVLSAFVGLIAFWKYRTSNVLAPATQM
ncbi:MAG: hypothetical protein ACLPZM_01180 [Thermoplasmata archaeon]